MTPNAQSSHEALLQGLNPQQIAAVTLNPTSSMLVLAGAGSGKTRVLTTRILWLLTTQQASPHSILAVTFTNKAAKEIQARILAKTGMAEKGMWLGTFHGLCHKLLRIHWHEAGLPQTFQIIDSADQLSVIRRLLKEYLLSEESIAPRLVQHFINQHKEQGQRSGTLTAKNDHDRQLIELFALYENRCQQDGLVDFAELLLRSYELFASNPSIVEHYHHRFSHILVDEFQDTNRLQYRWLRFLVGDQSTLFAVGDDDQSIYRFRGAEVGNMQSLISDYQIAEPIRLEQNYRSAGHILSAANAVIQKNAGRLDKKLWTERDDGDLLHVLEAVSDRDEAFFVAKEASALNKTGMALDHMAVLYRSNAQSRLFEQVLFDRGIPYRIYGGLRFFERQEIKHAIAYLRLMMNPEDNDALLRVINVPARGIGSRTLETLIGKANEKNAALWHVLRGDFGAVPDKLARFAALIEHMHSLTNTLLLPELVDHAVADSGLKAMYEQNKKERTDRLENLEELVNAAVNFAPEENMSPLMAFLNNAALESGEYQAQQDQTALQLMTIHAAKGLEFDVVFVCGLEEGLFPHENSLQKPEDLQEERRLMYVAITRAKQRLYLTCAKRRILHGHITCPIRSRFIDDIPAALMHVITPKSDVPQWAMKSKRYDFFSASNKAPATASASNDSPYRIGQRVRHDKFGFGIITDAEITPNYLRLQVNFATSDSKWLDMAYAKLVVCD